MVTSSRNFSIWVLEDDPSSVFVYEEILAIRYDVVFFDKIAEFNTTLQQHETRPDLLIADLKLKDGHFLRDFFLKDKNLLEKVKLIIVSSSDDLDVLRTCFEHGASDYLVKPFSKFELLAKVEKILGPSSLLKSSTPTKEHLKIDPFRFTVERPNIGTIEVTSRELQVVRFLWERHPKPANKQEMFEKIWNDNVVIDKTVDVHISKLRKKMESLQICINLIPPAQYCLKFL